MNDIKITGFYITSYGDESVGIFNQTWRLDGDFYFDSREDLEEMRQKIKEAFEVYADNLVVETFEEYDTLLKQENQLFRTNLLNHG
jgi:hypothetical protein